MKRRIYSLILALVLVVALGLTALAASGDTEVYRTPSGTKYHTESCSSLKGAGEAVTLEEAVKAGLEPCSKCNPPTLTASTTAAAPVSVDASAGTAAARSGISPWLTLVIGIVIGMVGMAIIRNKIAAKQEAEAAEEAAEAEE